MILVDEPRWPGRGRLWSHLVSDLSYDELHVFAEMLGAPRRAFDRDHYDIPDVRFRTAIWLGATLLPPRELAARLRAAGLRRPKHLARRSDSPGPSLRRIRQSVPVPACTRTPAASGAMSISPKSTT